MKNGYEKMDARKMAREVRLTEWSEIIREQKTSGQSIKAWCAANGIAKQRYFYWQRQLREVACEQLTVREERRTAASSPVFAEISSARIIPNAGVITVRIGEAVVEIPGDAPPESIDAVLRVLTVR
jgi:hypothetical protein